MIKYNTQLGAKHLNMEARMQRDAFLQPHLKGMHCRHCTGRDTEIKFKETTTYGAQPLTRIQYLTYDIDACCPEFKDRIEKKLINY